MYCGNCGKEASGKFCWQCGKEVENQERAPPATFEEFLNSKRKARTNFHSLGKKKDKNGEVITNIPGTNIPFTVSGYKADLGVGYQNIHVYLMLCNCLSDDAVDLPEFSPMSGSSQTASSSGSQIYVFKSNLLMHYTFVYTKFVVRKFREGTFIQCKCVIWNWLNKRK